MIRLDDSELHIWLSQPVGSVDAARLQRYVDVLTVDERTRAARHAGSGQYGRSVLTRFMARDVLSRYASIRPQDWRFKAGEFGKPRIGSPQDGPHFNVSHARDRIVMAVSPLTCGIDIEALDRDVRFRDVARRYFAPAEVEALRELSDVAARRRFIETWTLKEAFVKALGRGLSFALLKTFWFRFEPPGLSLEAGSALPAHWRFWCMANLPGFAIACAVPDAAPRTLTVWNYPFGADADQVVAEVETFTGSG